VSVVPTSGSVMDTDEFERRLGQPLRQLRGVLIARHGTEVGLDVHAEVVAYAWENRDDLASMSNPSGYLYRVSQSRVRRYRRWRRVADLPPDQAGVSAESPGDVRLSDALARLSADERTVAVIVHAYGYTYEEAAELLGTSPAAVRNRLHRGMTKLRRFLQEGPTDVDR